VFFVVFINTFTGLRSVNEDYVAIIRIMGASGWQVVREVFLPATLPFIIVGLRAGIPFSVIGAVVGEFIAATKGLGYFINYNQGTYDTNGIFVGVMILAIVVVVLDWLLSLVERPSNKQSSALVEFSETSEKFTPAPSQVAPSG
jgi:NitT/TauT family transport system permease protein